MHKSFANLAVVGLLTTVGLAAWAAPINPPAAVHVRGVIQRVSGAALTVKTVTGAVRVHLLAPVKVMLIVPSDRTHIKDHSFLGITSVPQPGGSQRAVEVHVFPESMRGAGEGTRAWDLPGTSSGGSKMTNGTAALAVPTKGAGSHSKMTNGTVSRQAGGTTLTLQYKDGTKVGTQTITIPPGIPIVTFVPGRLQDLKRGAHVFVIADRKPGGALTATRVMVGKNGLVPPM